MPPVRTCRLWVRDMEDTSHHVDVQASSMFEAAAAAVAAFRQHGWAAAALTANAIMRVEVQLPAVVHEVPLTAVDRWLRTPSTSPKEEITKTRLRPAQRR